MKSCHCANGVAPLKDLLSAYREQMSIPSFTGVLELVHAMPESVSRQPCLVQYWYGEAERSARKWDIAYMKKVFPDTVLVELKGQDHAEFFTLRPEEFCERLETFIRER